MACSQAHRGVALAAALQQAEFLPMVRAFLLPEKFRYSASRREPYQRLSDRNQR